MANEMRTFIKIISNKKEVSYKLQELFRYRQGNNEADALDVINYINGTEYSFSDETSKENWDKEVDFPTPDTWNKLINIDVDFPASLQEIDFRGNKLSELPKSLFSLPKLEHLDISDNPFTELPFVKNNALKTLKIARTPFGIFKSNILKTKQFYANCEVEEAVKYADDKTLYLSATKKYYSSIHLSGYHSYH